MSPAFYHKSIHVLFIYNVFIVERLRCAILIYSAIHLTIFTYLNSNDVKSALQFGSMIVEWTDKNAKLHIENASQQSHIFQNHNQISSVAEKSLYREYILTKHFFIIYTFSGLVLSFLRLCN